jgi:hypothetical protein
MPPKVFAILDGKLVNGDEHVSCETTEAQNNYVCLPKAHMENMYDACLNAKPWYQFW